MTIYHSILKQALTANQLTLRSGEDDQLCHYLSLLAKWNLSFNLTAITEPTEMVYLHIIDSLMVAPYVQGTQCLDVGSGAGLPGIPLAITHPDQHWVLLDKNGKKTRFMTQAIAELGLKNVQVVRTRSEDFHPTRCFDSILSRAYGALPWFVTTTEHLLCSDGLWIAMKGKYPEDEISSMPAHISMQQRARLAIAGIAAERHIICLAKRT